MMSAPQNFVLCVNDVDPHMFVLKDSLIDSTTTNKMVEWKRKFFLLKLTEMVNCKTSTTNVIQKERKKLVL